EDLKLGPDQEALFLSKHSVFRFASGPHPKDQGRTRTGAGLAGVAFTVRPLVSADRRYLRLHITQRLSQLVGVAKAKILDAPSGKEVEVEVPNVRKISVTGTVQLLDGNPFLMPVGYRPPDKGSEDKMWLLVARPFIWIEEEVKALRQEGGDLSAKAIWESDLQEEEKPAPVSRLPFNDEVKQVLQAIVTDVLTNPDLKRFRTPYGTAKDKTLTLVDDEKLGWPTEFKPETHGYRLVEVRPDPFGNQNRVLGIRLDKFDLKQKKVALFDTPIVVCLVNAGGTANGSIIGGCTVYY